MELLVMSANVVCWGTVAALWVALAVRRNGTQQRTLVRGSADLGVVVLALVSLSAILLVGRPVLASVRLDAAVPRVLGALVLAVSSAFAVWSRLALGTSWSIGPQARPDQGLKTDGPYAITRHPIYTGLLGMLLGSALLVGLGEWLVLVAAGLVVFGLKIRSEERILTATFPDAYRRYREHVPRLVPTWPGTRRT